MLKANGQFSKSERAGDSASAETKTHVEKKGYNARKRPHIWALPKLPLTV